MPRQKSPPTTSSAEKPADGRTLYAKKKQERNRKRILDSAIRVFSKKGYRASTIEDVLQAAKIGRATFYNHFRSKPDIFLELLADFMSKVNDAVLPITHGEEGAELSEIRQIEGNIRRIIELFERNKCFGTVLIREAYTADHECQAQIKNFFERLIDLTANSLSKGAVYGWLSVQEGHERTIAKIIIGSFKEVIFLPLSAGEIDAGKAMELAWVLVEYHVHGLGIGAAGPGTG